MSVNYQIVVDLVSNLLLVSFPISLIFVIADKVTDFLLSFIANRRVKL